MKDFTTSHLNSSKLLSVISFDNVEKLKQTT
jgi:hypothetical protein